VVEENIEAPEHVKEGKSESCLPYSAQIYELHGSAANCNWYSSTNLQFAYGRSELCFFG